MKDAPVRFSAFAQHDANQIAVVICVGGRVIDMPLSPELAHRLIACVSRALSKLES